MIDVDLNEDTGNELLDTQSDRRWYVFLVRKSAA